jgi:hypothetical protein
MDMKEISTIPEPDGQTEACHHYGRELDEK